MSKRETKKEHILNAGLEVMKTQGYNGTSVKDIVDQAKVPKGSFYNYFESKEIFALEALETVACESYRETKNALLSARSTPMLRLKAFFEQGIEMAAENEFKCGCFFGNMCQEMAASNDAIRDKVRYIFKRQTGVFTELLEQAKNAQEVSQNMNTAITAEFILNGWEGSLMRMKAVQSKEPLEAFLVMIEGLKK